MIPILLWLLFGALVGWLAGLLMKSKNSLLWNIIFGILGSVLGGFIASLLGFGSFWGTYSFDIVNLAISVGGACLVMYLVKVLKIRIK